MSQSIELALSLARGNSLPHQHSLPFDNPRTRRLFDFAMHTALQFAVLWLSEEPCRTRGAELLKHPATLGRAEHVFKVARRMNRTMLKRICPDMVSVAAIRGRYSGCPPRAFDAS